MMHTYLLNISQTHMKSEYDYDNTFTDNTSLFTVVKILDKNTIGVIYSIQ